MVELIWATPNAEALITKMARVSNPSNEDNLETAPRLLHYLVKHKHWSPFEMANMCVKINTQRDISAQILRHRSFTYQEFSTRYSEVTDVLEPIQLRRQDHKNRQNSIEDLDHRLLVELEEMITNIQARTMYAYKHLLASGVAKECARRILPLNTNTTMYMNGTLRSWIHYIQLRTGLETQKEHRMIAQQIKDVFCAEFPVIATAAFNMH